MYILYADESGSPIDPAQRHFVLSGVAIFERQCWWVERELGQIASQFLPAEPDKVELHGSPMFVGRGIWRSFPLPRRIEAIKAALHLIRPSMRVFAAVVEKSAISPRDPVEYAFEQVCSRFDHFLRRQHRLRDTQRGIIVFDKSSYEVSLQGLATGFRRVGHTWGVVRNLSEVPMFIDSRASRLVQLADLIGYSIYRKYERGDSQFFDIIKPHFDAAGGVVHGLHVTQTGQ